MEVNEIVTISFLTLLLLGAVKGDICQLPNNRGILTKAVRKEIRQFTPRQRAAYFVSPLLL